MGANSTLTDSAMGVTKDSQSGVSKPRYGMGAGKAGSGNGDSSANPANKGSINVLRMVSSEGAFDSKDKDKD